MTRPKIEKPSDRKRMVEVSYSLLVVVAVYFWILALLIPLSYFSPGREASGNTDIEFILKSMTSFIEVTYVLLIYLLIAMLFASFMGWVNLEDLHKRGATVQSAFRAWKRLLAGTVILFFVIPSIGYWSILGRDAGLINTFADWWQNDWGIYLAFGLSLTLANMFWIKRYTDQ